MFYQVKVFDKKGKLEKIIKPEELQEKHWENVDTTVDIKGLNDYDGEMQSYTLGNSIVFICPECGNSELTTNTDKKVCSSDCATRMRNRIKKEEELGYYE